MRRNAVIHCRSLHGKEAFFMQKVTTNSGKFMFNLEKSKFPQKSSAIWMVRGKAVVAFLRQVATTKADNKTP